MRALWTLLCALSLCLLWLLYWRLSGNHVDVLLKKDTPFALRLAIKDDRPGQASSAPLAFLAHLILFPKYKRILLYSLNTKAYKGRNWIRKLSPADADNLSQYTGIKTLGYIHLRASQGARLLDLAGGLHFFSDQTLFLKQARYQYPRGLRYYPGEHVTEYMTHEEAGLPSKLSKKSTHDHMELLFRQESMLLNLFWHRAKIAEHLGDSRLQNFAMSLLETDLSQPELQSLMAYILAKDVHMSVHEAPLALGKSQVLIVKENRAQALFQKKLKQFKKRWAEMQRQKDASYTLRLLNGTYKKGLGRKLKNVLQSRHIQILDVDNHEKKPIKGTALIVLSGNSFEAAHFMKILNIKPLYVSFQRQASDVDLVLLLGEDFQLRQIKLK